MAKQKKPKQKRKLRAAIAGVGDISMMHRAGYADNPDCELYALCDPDEKRLAARADQWRVPKTYTSYTDLLANPDVDIVEILTPHHMHADMVVAAAEAGKHVSVQKPMCNTLGEADRMIEAARRAGVKLKVFENFVFYPPYVKARELIAAGEIGEPLTVRFKLGTSMVGGRYYPLSTELWHLLEVEKGMGQAVYDDGYHKLSQAIDLFGDIDVVRGWVDRSFAFADMPGLLMWRYRDSDCLGAFDLGLSPNLTNKSKYFAADERIDITGTKGSISISRCSAQLLDTPALTLLKNGRRLLFDDIRADWMDSFADSTRHFVQCVLNDDEPLLTGERGKKVMQFAYACIIAGKTGDEIQPDHITDSMISEFARKPTRVTFDTPGAGRPDKITPREALLQTHAQIIYTAMTGAMRVPDSLLTAIIKPLRRAFAGSSKPETAELSLALEELEGFFSGGTDMSAALRRILLDARPSQVKSVIRGYLLNYVYNW